MAMATLIGLSNSGNVHVALHLAADLESDAVSWQKPVDKDSDKIYLAARVLN
jgi:hypothetical protein